MTGFAPQNEHEMIEVLTGIFEGGSYCALADESSDVLGRLSYGKHQASEAQGSLVELLNRYVGRTAPPLPNPAFQSALTAQLQLYDASGRRYQGTSAQRAEYKLLLKEACQDPAMQRAQDEFFDERYYTPAVANAALFGIATPLGRAMCYDIAIQAGPRRMSFFRQALAAWKPTQAVQPCSACSPKDEGGPDEPSFLLSVNGARRSEMLASSSAAYRAAVYRPNEFDKLIAQKNFDFKQNFVFKGVPIKGLP